MSEEEILARVQNLIDYINFKPDRKYNTHFAIIAYPEEQWFNAIQGLLDLYNKEKATSHYIQSQLDIANAKLIEEKEINEELKQENRVYSKQILDAYDKGWIHKDKIKAEKENINKLIRYIALKENKDYEDVKKEFEI